MVAVGTRTCAQNDSSAFARALVDRGSPLRLSISRTPPDGDALSGVPRTGARRTRDVERLVAVVLHRQQGSCPRSINEQLDAVDRLACLHAHARLSWAASRSAFSSCTARTTSLAARFSSVSSRLRDQARMRRSAPPEALVEARNSSSSLFRHVGAYQLLGRRVRRRVAAFASKGTGSTWLRWRRRLLSANQYGQGGVFLGHVDSAASDSNVQALRAASDRAPPSSEKIVRYEPPSLSPS